MKLGSHSPLPPLIYSTVAVSFVVAVGLSGGPESAMRFGAVFYALPIILTGTRYLGVAELRGRSYGLAIGLAFWFTAGEALVDLSAGSLGPQARFWITSGLSASIVLLGLLGIVRRVDRPAVSAFTAQAGVEAALLGSMFAIVAWRWLFLPLGGLASSGGYPMVWLNLAADFLMLGLAVVVLAVDLDRGAFYLHVGLMGGLLADVWVMYAFIADVPFWYARVLGIPAMAFLAYGAELLSARRPITDEDAMAGFERRRVWVVAALVVAILAALAHAFFMPVFDRVTLSLMGLFVVLLGARDMVQVVRSRSMLEALRETAIKDPLTGLRNRRALSDDLETIVGEPCVSVLVLDLDRFKVVNDLAGHTVGDQVLKAVAHAMDEVVGRHHALAYRLGGDEFAVVARLDPRAAEDLATLLADEVTRAASEVAVAAQMHLGASIGVHHLQHPEAAEIAGALVQSGHAMREAKSNGRGGTHVFDESLQNSFRRRQAVEFKLRNSLADVVLAYQPIVHQPTGKVAGFEALARWVDPQLGFVSPEEFIDIAEQSSLVIQLGEMLLDRALREMVELGSIERGMSINVNVSPLQLLAPAFPEKVQAILTRHQVPAHLLILEVTESHALEPDGLASAALRRLRRAGVGIAVDDFGAGQTSVGYLPRLDITSVKLDRSLTAGVGQRSSEAVLRGVNYMSANLGLDVVMEGVEDETQVNLARELDVTYLQGYFFARPVPPGELAESVASVERRATPARN